MTSLQVSCGLMTSLQVTSPFSPQSKILATPQSKILATPKLGGPKNIQKSEHTFVKYYKYAVLFCL